MNDTTMPKKSQSPGLSDLVRVRGWGWAGIYQARGDVYRDDELSELKGDKLERSLKLVMKDQIEKIEEKWRDQELTPHETMMQGISVSD